MMTATFVYDGSEVVKTGREAVKEIKVPTGKGPPRQVTLVEITPVGEQDGWKKWVDPAHLYEVRTLAHPALPLSKIVNEHVVPKRPK